MFVLLPADNGSIAQGLISVDPPDPIAPHPETPSPVLAALTLLN
jgi:hypothetical protein